MADRVLDWTMANMWDPRSGWFSTRSGAASAPRSASCAGARHGCRGRWPCASRHVRVSPGGGPMRGFPGRELALDPSRSRFERLYARVLGAPANGLRIRLRRVLPATAGDYRTILDAGSGPGVFSYELAKRHPEAEVLGVDSDPDLVARANEVAALAGLDQLPVRRARRDAARLRQAVRHGGQRRQPRARRGRRQRHAGAPGLAAARAAAWSSTSPATSGAGSSSGAGSNFDVPGHVRPGYRAEELVAKLSAAGFEVTSHQATYGLLETFTNNISYVISGADQRRKGAVRRSRSRCSSPSLGSARAPSRRWGAGVLATAVRPAGDARRRAADRCGSSIDILHPAHVHFFRNFHGEMTEPRPRAPHHGPGEGPLARAPGAVRPSVRAALDAADRRRGHGHRDGPAHRAAAGGDEAVPARRHDRHHGPVHRGGRRRPPGPGGRLLRHRVRPADQLVHLPARPQRVHAGLLPGQGAGSPSHATPATTSWPTSIPTGSGPTPIGWPRSGWRPTSRSSSCASCRGRPSTTARRRA